MVAMVMVVEGGYGGSPSFRDHQVDFEEDLTEGVAFENTGHPLEDTAELLDFRLTSCYYSCVCIWVPLTNNVVEIRSKRYSKELNNFCCVLRLFCTCIVLMTLKL